MEAMQLLAVGVAVLAVVVAAAYWRRRRSRHAPRLHTTKPMPVIEVGDADVARRLIIDHADSFSNHHAVALAVDFDAGHPKTQSITSAPYGPLWRALRGNLTANILHPSRLAHLVLPIQRHAVEALVADLSASARGGEAVVAVRDGVYAAVFATMARLCLGGDGEEIGDIPAMQRTLREFFHSGVDARLLARSRLLRLLHWRQWRHLLGTRRRLAELFGPAIAARRRRGNCGIISTYVDSLLDVRIPNDNDGDVAEAETTGGESLGRRRALREDEVVRLVWEFLGSSTEAVVACVEWTLARLVTEPEVQNKLHQELTAGDHRKGQISDERLRDFPYLRAVILESLRLHPPLPLVVREVGPEGAVLAGAARPPDGTFVRFTFLAEDIGRDHRAWTDPEMFRPERFLAGGEGEDVSPVPGPKEIKMMPFGAGRRHCPGAGLSMIHVGSFVAALVREFHWAPPADGAGVDLTATNALFVKVMASPLKARVTPRASQS
ncbi:unnamed protein product [Urochloa decumbens]|uniref:Cytochrome P450 n=1 Tax=Urochloa decumbens TaxID=240449 RepID=A0ABC9E8W5_9POAL